jgi:hypothetical protein
MTPPEPVRLRLEIGLYAISVSPSGQVDIFPQSASVCPLETRTAIKATVRLRERLRNSGDLEASETVWALYRPGPTWDPVEVYIDYQADFRATRTLNEIHNEEAFLWE